MSDNKIEYNIDDTPMTDDEIMGYLKRIGIECDINTDLNSLKCSPFVRQCGIIEIYQFEI